MITGLSKRHNGEKGAIHYRKTDIPDLIAGFAENDLAQFIFQSEILSLCALYFPQDLIHRSIGGIQDKGSPVDLLFSFVKCRHLITVRFSISVIFRPKRSFMPGYFAISSMR